MSESDPAVEGAEVDKPALDNPTLDNPTLDNSTLDGPAAALAQARAMARAKGHRPGRAGKRRVIDAPDRVAKEGRDPRLLGDQLDMFVAERGWRPDVAVGSVIGRWPQIVGPDVAAHCQPTDFTDAVLTIRAESTSWATQLGLLASSLLARLSEDVGEGVVSELRIVGPSAPSWSKGALRASKGRGPRDTYG